MPQYLINAVANYVFVLVLNPMRSNAEAFAQFGPFPTREAALGFHDSFLLPATFVLEQDGKVLAHVFSPDSPLAGMNKLSEAERTKPGVFQHGIHEVFGQLLQVNSKTPFVPDPSTTLKGTLL